MTAQSNQALSYGTRIGTCTTSPFFPAVYGLKYGHQVASGTKVRSCVIRAFTRCRAANLRNADLQGGFLAYSDLRGADLRGADLTDANLSHTAPIGVNLAGADTTGTIFCNTIMPNGTIANPSPTACPGS